MSDDSSVTVVEERVPLLDHVDQYLQLAVEYGASDLHLPTGAPPSWRLSGQIGPIWPNSEVLTAEHMEFLAKGFMTGDQWDRLQSRGDADFAYSNVYSRFRSSVIKQRLGLEMVFRVINSKVRTVGELGLPEAVINLTKYHNGLVLVTGRTGSGKSTTLASLIDYINTDRDDHIITLEDPIEFLFESKKCQVTQREVGQHTKSFSTALRACLREDPDILMVGEMRDLETISLAITAAETGHLVMGTLHTGSAARTLDRVLDVFPLDQREQIRIMVAESLRGVISQQLVPKIGGGRVMAMEILLNSNAVGACIRDGKTFMLPGIMQTGKNVGMITMDDSLQGHYLNGLITAEECLGRCEDKINMKIFLEKNK